MVRVRAPRARRSRHAAALPSNEPPDGGDSQNAHASRNRTASESELLRAVEPLVAHLKEDEDEDEESNDDDDDDDDDDEE